jgi:drug/metabolite transporter (DMT)-like permease
LLFLLLAPSAAALWTAAHITRVRLPKAALLPPIALLGVLNPGVVYTLNLMGLSRVSASVTALLWAAEPLVILILAAALLREPVSGRLLAVLAVGVVGVALVAGLAEGFHRSGSEPVGILLLLLAVLCCAFYTVASRSLSGSADPLVLVTIQQTAGLCWSVAFLSAGTPYGGSSDIANIALPQLAAAVLSGLMYYAAAYWLYLAALRSVPAAVAGGYFNAIPIFGVGLAIAFLGETLTAIQWAGVAAITLSVTGLTRLTQ